MNGLAAADGQPVGGWASPHASAQVLGAFVSPLVGIAREVSTRMRETDDLVEFTAAATSARSSALLGVDCNRSNGGASVDLWRARLSAVGETVERYSAAFVPWGELRWDSVAGLVAAGERCVGPESFVPYASWQYDQAGFGLRRFVAEEPLWWVQGLSVGGGGPVWVPAQVVFVAGELPGDRVMVQATSNGLAYGSSVDETLVSGACELVERDAVMLAWWRRLTFPRIDPGSDARLARFFRRHVRPTGLEVSLVDLSAVGGVPTVMAITRNVSTGVAPFGMGAAAHADPLRAAVKAVNESVSTRAWSLTLGRPHVESGPGAVAGSAPAAYDESVRTFADHLAVYAGPELLEATRFLDAGAVEVALGDLPVMEACGPGGVRDELSGRLASQGVELMAVDVTAPDVTEAGGAVVRSFSPQLIPLDPQHRYRAWGHPRLTSRPAELGFPVHDLNPLPHPFP